MSMISLKGVSKFYHNKATISSGFTRVNLDLNMGEFVVITGESGSGKSTLLNVISGLDSYEEGEMYINGEETSHYTEVDYENYRRKYIGNIFQHFNLVNSYTVYQNVELVLLLNGYKREEIKKEVLSILETVGLTKYKNTKASKLSGGQKQRVAIARALAKDTPIIVADEPTGNLDVKSAKSIMKLLSDISKDKLVVIVTHNYEQVEAYATRKISMNDGKIIEDKKLKKYEPCDAQSVDYADLTTKNKIMLSVRNAFNIKSKFVLLFLVYFFLTLLVFSEYSSLQKKDFTDSLSGYNNMFQDISPERVLIRREDKKLLTEEDISKVENLNNISKVVRDEAILDYRGALYSEKNYFYVSGRFDLLNEDMEADKGTLPRNENEILIKGNRNSYEFIYEKDLLGMECQLQDNMTFGSEKSVRIVGIIYDDEMDEDDYVFYIKKSDLKFVKNSYYSNYNDVTVSIEEKVKKYDDYFTFRKIEPNEFVARGKVYFGANLANNCVNQRCLGEFVTIDVENMYYKEKKSFEVTNIFDKTNAKTLTGLSAYELYQDSMLINPLDYEELFTKGPYQISIFLEDMKESEKTLNELKDLGFRTYYLKDNLVDEMGELKGMVRIMRNVVFIIATVALFFISYFIIKIILKSRNVYFSTIRILGATKKVARELLNLELLVDINVAFWSFMALVFFVNSKVVGWKYLQDLVSFFTARDYVVIYIILVIMSLLISNRYAHKLFKDSVMNTYREEV